MAPYARLEAGPGRRGARGRANAFSRYERGEIIESRATDPLDARDAGRAGGTRGGRVPDAGFAAHPPRGPVTRAGPVGMAG